MLFNSLLFLFLFLPVVWGGFHLCVQIGHRFAVGWLVLSSLFFYGWWTPTYLFLLCGSIVFNYTVGRLIHRTMVRPKTQMTILTGGIAANLLLLGYYKYFFPSLHWFEQYGFHFVAPDASVILPLGISFFTFTQIGYLVDSKAGVTASGRFLDYTLFVTFFPHLLAGPILHHREMMPQFENKTTWGFKADNLAMGLAIFFIGLAKKDIVADYFASYANIGFGNPGSMSMVQAWTGVTAFSMQLYFDFSGYSEMAIGLALLFNIRFPANFDSPYKSASIIDFWQRWHMTFTRYLNLYIYNPIALLVTRRRTKNGQPVGRQGQRTFSGFSTMVLVPTFVTVILAGIWHGAGLQFIIFGLLHALYLSINHVWRLLTHKKNVSEPVGFARWWSVIWKVFLTYLAVLVAEIFFRSRSVSDAFIMLANLIDYRHDPLLISPDFNMPLAQKFLIATFALVWFAPNMLQLFAPFEPTLSKPHATIPTWMQWKPNVAWAVTLALLATFAILAIGGQSEFLYFRF